MAVLMGLMMALPGVAFDPAGPPPKKTMAWTVASVSQVIVPSVDFRDATVEDAVAFLTMSGPPKAYRASIDISQLGEKAQQKLTLHGRQMTLLKILGAIAQEIEADLLISPGTVSLVPRSKEG